MDALNIRPTAVIFVRGTETIIAVQDRFGKCWCGFRYSKTPGDVLETRVFADPNSASRGLQMRANPESEPYLQRWLIMAIANIAEIKAALRADGMDVRHLATSLFWYEVHTD